MSRCRDCDNAKSRRHYQQNREKVIERVKDAQRARRRGGAS
jgi:hypothetical protein